MQSNYRLICPSDYHPKLDLLDTEEAIKWIKFEFQGYLSKALNLKRVSAPLFVFPETGLNDNLNGIEKPVSFNVKNFENKKAEVVQSLAKWKRLALARYKIKENEGLYTDMNAIRPDECFDNLHSLYVDQWDWEKVIGRQNRNINYLRTTVLSIYSAFLKLQNAVQAKFPQFSPWLPEEIHFVTAQELEDKYPDKTAKERENLILREKKAVFIQGIGNNLKSGEKHDGRACDYDDWSLNGDIIFYHPLLDCAFEISSMGIRVDQESLLAQAKISGDTERLELPFQKAIMQNQLPLTIGGGIGQSRLCMFFLQKVHIGEVQASIWPGEMIEKCSKDNIALL
ncbi:MAG: aspartate--ammonia ligase [Bacteroidales bacterium]